VHARVVVPEKEWLATFYGLVHEIERGLEQLFFGSLHALAREWPGIVALLFAPGAETRVGGFRIVRSQSNATQHPAGTKLLVKAWLLRIVGVFRLFLGVEVVEVSVKKIEAVDSGQEFVSVAQVVFPYLSGGLSEWLEQISSCRIFLLQAERRTGQPDSQKTCTERMLPRNERRPPRCAALLGIVIRE
jgi:hypothetical protein